MFSSSVRRELFFYTVNTTATFWFQSIVTISLISLTAKPGRYSFFTVREGDDVTLPCQTVMWEEVGCYKTTWYFSGSAMESSVELIRYGQRPYGAASDRLVLTRNCSLVIEKVTATDGGFYTCRKVEPVFGDLGVNLYVATREYLHPNVFSSDC